jgi:hypothetical protein
MQKYFSLFLLQISLTYFLLCRGAEAEAQSIPLPIEKWAGKTVIFIYAHIDDMEAGSGGLVKRLHEEVSEVDIHLLIMTKIYTYDLYIYIYIRQT